MKKFRKYLQALRPKDRKLPMAIEEFPPEERAWREALMKKQATAHRHALAHQKEQRKAE
jgi:hypothetical protein